MCTTSIFFIVIAQNKSKGGPSGGTGTAHVEEEFSDDDKMVSHVHLYVYKLLCV